MPCGMWPTITDANIHFGAVPCLLFQLPFEALTGIRDPPPALPMILLAWLYILATSLALGEAGCAPLALQASAAAYLLTAAGGIGQIYYLLHRLSVYEYAILRGATFVLRALWQWLCAANTPVNRRKALTFHPRVRPLHGYRGLPLPDGAALALPILWPRYITESVCAPAGVQGKPLRLSCLLCLWSSALWYNAARFGSPFDFGANYNLTSNDMTRPRLCCRAHRSGSRGPSSRAFPVCRRFRT